jgi:hypothetical protein
VVTRPALELCPGDQVRQPSGAWLTVAARPRPNPRGPHITWPYLGGSTGTADWLDCVPCRPAHDRKGAS